MAVELPKDAEGREIPLDTVVLFSRSGEAYDIVRWIYTTDFETWTESNTWRAVSENHRALDPELMYLTPPDSWEQLEKDSAAPYLVIHETADLGASAYNHTRLWSRRRNLKGGDE